MIYRITYDGDVIYDPRGANPTDGMLLVDGTADLYVGRASVLDIVLPAENTMADSVPLMQGELELTRDGVRLFRGRAVRLQKTMWGETEIEAESAMAYLRDSAIAPFKYPDDVENLPAYQAAENKTDYFFRWILSKHNAQVGAARQIKAGTVTVVQGVAGLDGTGSTILEFETDEYKSAFDILKELAGDNPSHNLVERYENDGNYLDYLQALPDSPVVIKPGKNMLDYKNETYGGDLYTAILPVGKDGLTMAGYPDADFNNLHTAVKKSGSVIYSPALETDYGRIVISKSYSDAEDVYELGGLSVGDWPYEGSISREFEIKVFDLSAVDEDETPLAVGKRVRLSDGLHGAHGWFDLKALKLDILDPGKTEVTLKKEITV